MVQYCWVPKNVLPKNGQAGISRFLRTCQARNLKIRTVWIIVCEMCADLALCTRLKPAALIADKNVNQLELRELRTVPGYDTEPHILQHLTVLYA